MAYIAAMEEVIALYALDVTQRRLARLGNSGPTAYDKQPPAVTILPSSAFVPM